MYQILIYKLYVNLACIADVKRSQPTNIEAKTSKEHHATPRTPHHKDSKTAPRFYPVVKENRAPDPLVSLKYWLCFHLCFAVQVPKMALPLFCRIWHKNVFDIFTLPSRLDKSTA